MKKTKLLLLMLIGVFTLTTFTSCEKEEKETLIPYIRDAAIQAIRERYSNKDDFNLISLAYTPENSYSEYSEYYYSLISKDYYYPYVVTFSQLEPYRKTREYLKVFGDVIFTAGGQYYTAHEEYELIKEEPLYPFDKQIAMQTINDWFSDYMYFKILSTPNTPIKTIDTREYWWYRAEHQFDVHYFRQGANVYVVYDFYQQTYRIEFSLPE